MKYKVGDKVRIREDLNTDMSNVVEEMTELAGQVVTIQRIVNNGDYPYALKGEVWAWGDDMFAGLADAPVNEKKNLMPEVAALLGVEIGEEFDIGGIGVSFPTINPFKITENGLIGHKRGEINCSIYRLLTGEWTIIKKPWKPKDGGRFYFVMKNGKIAESRFFDVAAIDHALLYSGNCFRTEQEAETNRPAIMEKFGWK